MIAAIAARERCLRILSNSSNDTRSSPDSASKGTPGAAQNGHSISEIADSQQVPSNATNGKIGAAVEEGNDEAVEINSEQRADWTGKMVMYGSTQTHSLGAKVSVDLDKGHDPLC